MNIQNSSTGTVSWFCFNQLDASKVIALGSGDLTSGQSYSYLPPDNMNGYYGVRFTMQGGGDELAEGSVSKNGGIVLVEGTGGAGTYTTQVT